MAKEKLLLDVSLDYEQPQRHGWCSDLSKFLCECAPVPAIGFVSVSCITRYWDSLCSSKLMNPCFTASPPGYFCGVGQQYTEVFLNLGSLHNRWYEPLMGSLPFQVWEVRVIASHCRLSVLCLHLWKQVLHQVFLIKYSLDPD